MENIFLGALEDNRSEEAKSKDYFFNEIVATANPVNWVEKPESQWRTFPVQNQNGSGSCVAQTARKLLRVLFHNICGKDIDFSASHIYQRRSNKPQGGMIGVDAMEILRQGTSLNALMQSDNMNDMQMDGIPETDFDRKIGDTFKISNYVQLAPKSFDEVASVIQTTGKAVMVWFFFTPAEWSKLIPTIDNPNLTVAQGARHSTSAVDITLKNGKEYIIIEDSAHFGGLSRRLISREFFNARNFFCAYPMNFKYTESEVPVAKITKTLKLGMTDPEVKILQDILKAKGYYATNIDSTGYFGGVTLRAVKDFQTAYNLEADGVVGPLTRAIINK